MEFRVLGPLEVIGRNGIPVEVPSAPQRRLACLLLIRAGSVLSADYLGDTLGLSAGALRTAISRLRKVLGFATLVSVPPGYQLRADVLDASEFEHRLAAAAADPVSARRLLEEALALWRGEAYAEFGHEDWAAAETTRLTEMHTGAVESLVELFIAEGEFTAAIARLEPLIAAHPFRDRPRGLHMRALTEAGRRTDALRAFQSYRSFLIDEIGTEPSADLVALDRAIAAPAVPGPTGQASTDNVTVLFTDLVPSMLPATHLSPDAADEVRRHHFAILRQAVAEAGGTEVKNLGDGLMAVFLTASAALSCAIAMQQEVQSDNRTHEYPVGLRVGMSGGEVTREDDDYSGEPVVEAARLSATSEGGQILAASVVQAMAGRRSRHRCRPVGPLVLQGLPDPVEVVEVLWESLARPAVEVPLPSRLKGRPAVGVVGREIEIETMANAAKRAASGEDREVLLLAGEAGQGKTTLMAVTAQAVFDTGACVLFGHCEEGLANPYQLFTEAIGHYVIHAPEERLLAHVAAYGSELARLVPALATRVPNLPPGRATDSDTERYLLFAAVTGLLEVASQHQPVVLVFDDLQWADAASLELLRHLAASNTQSRLLILGSFRDTELSRTHPLLNTLASLRRQSRVTRLELAGLDDAAVVSLVEAAAGHPLDEDALGLAQALHRETDGNPFFVGEVLRHLSETGAIRRDAAGRWVVVASLETQGLPDSVREVIGARIGRMGETAARVLSLAAVIGREFDVDLLTMAAAVTEDDLLEILDAAAAVALVRELPAAGRYNFVHALIQHTLYEEIGPTRRARAHRHVAEALESLCAGRPGGHMGELARHWLSTDHLEGRAKALDYSRQAADAALRALAPGEALRYYAQALEVYGQVDDPDPVLGLDLAIGLGTAERQTGNPAFRATLLDAARRAASIDDTGRLVAAALANNRGIQSAAGTIDLEKVEVLELALDRISGDSADRALILSTLCAELAFGSPLEQRKTMKDEALMIARTSGDDTTIMRVLNNVFIPLMVPPLLEDTLARTADAMKRIDTVGDPVLRFFAFSWRAEAVGRAGHIDEMDRCREAAGSLARQLDQPGLLFIHALQRGLRAQIAGDTDRAEELALEALQVGTDGGQPDAALYFGAQLLVVQSQRGTMGEMIPQIEQIGATTPDLGASALNGVLARAHAEVGRLDDVRHLLEEFATDNFDLHLDSIWFAVMAGWAEAAIDYGDPLFAGPIFDRLAPWAEQLATGNGVTADCPVSHFLGGLATVLGRYDEAESYLAHATSFNERAGAKFFAARTDVLKAKMLAQRGAPGDAETARTFLTTALAAAVANGYAHVERRAAEALQMLNR